MESNIWSIGFSDTDLIGSRQLGRFQDIFYRDDYAHKSSVVLQATKTFLISGTHRDDLIEEIKRLNPTETPHLTKYSPFWGHFARRWNDIHYFHCASFVKHMFNKIGLTFGFTIKWRNKQITNISIEHPTSGQFKDNDILTQLIIDPDLPMVSRLPATPLIN